MKKALLICCIFSYSLLTSQESFLKKDNPFDHTLKKLADSSFVAYFNGNHKIAVKTNLALLELAEKLNDSYYLHKGYSILGYNYLAQRDTIKAKESFKKSEKYALLSNNESALGRTYLDLANLYAGNKNLLQNSFVHFDHAIQLFNKTKDSTSLASAHYYTIVAAMQAKDYERAFYHITKMQYYIHNIEDDNFCEISVHNQMAHYYTKMGNYPLADQYYALVIKESEKKKFWNELENTYLNYSESLYKQGRIDEAYKSHKQYVHYFKINEELRLSEYNQKLVAQFELENYKKEADKAEIEKAYLNQIAESKTNRNTLLTILSIALLSIFVFLLIVLGKKRHLVISLKEQNRKYLIAKKDAEYLSISKNNFLSTVSHELRTPLYGVIGISSILLEDTTLNHQKENLKSLKFSADYLLALINDVLQINKIDATNEENGQKTTFCITKLLETIINSFQYKRNERNNKVHLDVQEDTPDLIAGNDTQLSQILMNIIGNAHKFSKDGDIFVSVKPLKVTPTSLDLQFKIRDTGIGIAKDKLKLIFDEFSQIPATDSTQQGTGLGLSIVKRLLAKSNSEAHVESELGKGTTFTFTLPFELIKQKVTEPFEAPISFADTRILMKKKILIVDDNAINRAVTKKILEKKSVICDLANDGEEAIEKIRENHFDLILMDVNMPVKDGMQATREIRTFNPKIPIIALTAVEIEDMKDKIFDSGMNDIVLKPYNINEFHKVLINNI